MEFNSILIYENDAGEMLYPFTIMHCAWEQRIGCLRLFEKIRKIFPDKRIMYSGRDNHLKSFFARFEIDNEEIKKENILVISSSFLPSKKVFTEINEKYDSLSDEDKERSVIFYSGIRAFALLLNKKEIINPTELDKKFIPRFLSDFNELFVPIEIKDINFVDYLWDSLDINGKAIGEDLELIDNLNLLNTKNLNIYTTGSENIWVGKNVTIMPGSVLTASKGPIIIDDEATIMPNVFLEGPCYIGKKTLIKAGAKIYCNTSIGEKCKIGGEVEDSVILAYTNKQHEGFLGHSYLCEWINLGADTNTSDLKNTYSEIKVKLRGETYNTHRMFLGLLCGDHSKSGINSMFNSGTVCGVSANLFSEWYLPKEIPSFTWGGNPDASSQYELDKALETARTVMARRNMKLLKEEEELLSLEFTKSNVARSIKVQGAM